MDPVPTAPSREPGPRDPAEPLRAWLVEHEDELVALTARLARMESPSAEPEAQEPLFELLAEELSALGFRCRRIRGRATGGCLYARPALRSRGAPAQLLLGHADTVWPRGTLGRMPVVASEGRLTGPGVYDMKGGLAQGLFALRALAALDIAPTLTPVVLVNGDEEIGSPESTRWVRRVARAVERVLVLEPSLGPEGRAKTARKAVGRFTLRVAGRASHAGLDPEAGVSAIAELADLVRRLHALADPERGVTVNVGRVEGGLGPNVVAPEATAWMETRVLTREDAARVEAAIRGLAPERAGARIEVEGGFAKRPLERTPRNAALFEAAVRCADRLGFALGEGTAGGASDGNTTSLHAATLDGLGAVGGHAHAAGEFLWTEKLVERAALLALLLLEPGTR